MPAAILARFVVLEARRGGLPWLAAASIALALGLAAFLSQVALTESLALQASIVAALLRASAVFLIAAHVASSTLREINDKELERMLSLPLSRSTQYLGRLAGFALCGAALAVACAAPLLLWASAGTVALWALRSEEHTSELQSRPHLVCRLLLEKKKNTISSSWPSAVESLARAR